jgi:riboflavin kinase / FMN adenylyltransferase
LESDQLREGVNLVPGHRERQLELAASIVTIGAFDGVHRGHRELIRSTIDAAQRRDLAAVVYTFDVPPKVYFGQAEALISLDEKLDRIAALGPDHIIVARFDLEYARRTAADFVTELKQLRPQQILVGGDFKFGSCKGGDVAFLQRFFDTRAIAPVRGPDGSIVSSSRIRSLRRCGLAEAASVLEGWSGPSVALAPLARDGADCGVTCQ